MISFACQACGMKFRVKDEFAGRSRRCPTCKQPLTVPSLETLATVAPSKISGQASSLARAGLNGDGVTLAYATSSDDHRNRIGEALTRNKAREERYVVEEEIARGGMGAVLRAIDGDLRREVAVKYLLDQVDTKKKLRFVEEAQITGQLEHPNIVPIHELGVDAQGNLFFSMKMVRGRSLKEALDAARGHSGMSLNQFLTLFISICHALAYAHSRGVVHRDLKPANIMLGDFGEVYVMDWGLAKVMDERPAPPPIITLPGRASSPPPAALPTDSGSSARVSTSRGEDSSGDLTQDGSVLGTPVYMPPEQATGKIQQIDQRSDIYSLGAILYEVLTLEPPVSKEGGNLAVLVRVSLGEIKTPEQRAPTRAQKGLIPRELAAVAMKALAKDPGDRYQTVESVRKDIQLFLEGRSVSAKQDTFWEMSQKLVKRNKGVSIATAAALVVVLVVASYFIKVNYDARVRAEVNYTAYQKEQTEKEKRTRAAVPALVQAARLNVERRDLDQAAAQVNLALDYAPANHEARLLKAQLLIARKRFAAGVRELDDYLKARPSDREAKALRELCTTAEPGETSNLLKITALFVRQNVPGLAETALSEFGPNLTAAREQLLKLYRDRLENNGWPGWRSRLSVDNSGMFRLITNASDAISTLAPLQGIPLTTIEFQSGSGRSTNFAVNDLSPLKGMQLRSLKIGCGPQVHDLSPLQGMPLEHLHIGFADSLTDLSPLQGMQLVSLKLHYCNKVADLSPLQGMPLNTFDAAHSVYALDLTPFKGMKFTSVTLNKNVITNRESMQVLRDMPSLRSLWFTGHGTFSAEDFWKKYDAGELKR